MFPIIDTLISQANSAILEDNIKSVVMNTYIIVSTNFNSQPSNVGPSLSNSLPLKIDAYFALAINNDTDNPHQRRRHTQ